MTGVHLLIQGSYGGICLNECERNGWWFSYCQTTANRWDYCSNIEEVTATGKVCRENHACGFHEQPFLWCYTDDNNNWDYCSLFYRDAVITHEKIACLENDPCVKKRWFRSSTYCYIDDNNNWDYCNHSDKITESYHRTRYGYLCLDSCKTYDGDKYNTCPYKYRWLGGLKSSSDYCSSQTDFTIAGIKCSDEYPCDKYGKEYYWCNKQERGWIGSSWDYCSPVDNCDFGPTWAHRVKRQIYVCPQLSDVTMCYDNNTTSGLTDVKGDRTKLKQIQTTIASWNLNSVEGNAKPGTICTTKTYRIDLQGTKPAKEKDKRMANVQVQSNTFGKKKQEKSESVAGILFPCDVMFSRRRFRRALLESFNLTSFITMNPKAPNCQN